MKRKTKGMLAAAAALMCIFVASGCGKSGGGSDASNPASSGSGETAAQNSKYCTPRKSSSYSANSIPSKSASDLLATNLASK